MPICVGSVGAENSHTAAIGKLINVEKRIPGVKVPHVWGETKALARKAAEVAQIPHIVETPDQMVGQVDAACVDHRHGKYHLPAVKPLLEAKVPLFVDKPFCYRKAEGKRFLARAAELGVPVCSYSVLPKQKSFVDFKRKMRSLGKIHSLVSTGPCDIKSKRGGVYFNGKHKDDMVINLLGYDMAYGEVVRGTGKNHAGVITYKSGAVASMNLVGEGRARFRLSAIGENGRLDEYISFDENTYLSGTRTFCRMFKTGKTSETAETMLGPVAALEALEKSISKGSRVRINL